MKQKTVIVLGSASHIKDYGKYLKKTNKDALLLVIDKYETPKSKLSKSMQYFRLKTKKNGLKKITDFCDKNNFDIFAVLNRVDSYEILHGKLCDFYKVMGPSEKSIKRLANKDRMHKLMIKSDLSFYRPRTIISNLEKIENDLDRLQYPVIMKVSRGVKSRGVVTLKSKSDFYVFKDLFIKQGIFKKSTVILFEQIIIGKQVTPVMYVNSKGKINILALVDVVTAREVKQNHMQLVYRSTPSIQSEAIRQKIAFVMQKIITKSKLRSVMLHPEFIVVGKSIYLIEVNVRIGGFRYDLMKKAYNIDLNKISWDISIDDFQIEDHINSDLSCTGCEVWEEHSGVISELKFPQSRYISGFVQQKFIGDEYVAPPEDQKSIAKFYVTSKENSLGLAKQLRKKIIINF